MVMPPAGSVRRSELVLQRRLSRGVNSLTRLDLSASRLPATSTGLAVILKNDDSYTQAGTDTKVCVVGGVLYAEAEMLLSSLLLGHF